jgi:squalene synthase HpnC
MAANHYENFPVASILLPRRIRRAVEIIYHFAREADDFADEGNMPDAERLAKLDEFRAELKRIENGEAAKLPLFEALGEVVNKYRLPIQLLHDLLDAFAQDVVKKRYANFDELLDYCRRSANPVGRLLLHLYDEATPQNLIYSDNICTSLQLINFWQDVQKDYAIARIYLPQDEMTRYKVSEAQIAAGLADNAWQRLMQFQVERARAMMQTGAPLGTILGGRIGLEMRLIIAGGKCILRKLDKTHYDMFKQRPMLRPLDWLIMLLNSAPFKF